MPPVMTGSVTQHLTPGLRGIIGTKLKGREAFYSNLYDVETTVKNFEDYLAATGMPIAVEKPQGADIQSFDILEGNTKRLTPVAYAIGGEVTQEAWEDDLYKGGPGSVSFFEEGASAIRELGEGLADSMAERVELEAHLPFINGFSSPSSVLPDSSTFFSLTHAPITGAQGVAQANRPTVDVDLNLTSLRAGLTQMRLWKDDQGKRIPGYATPKTLFVSPADEYLALELLRSSDRPDTANRAVNVTKGAVELICDPYFADESGSDAWFLQADKHFAKFLWRKRPEMDSFDDRRAKVSIFTAYMRFVCAPVHWLGFYGSPGA